MGAEGDVRLIGTMHEEDRIGVVIEDNRKRAQHVVNAAMNTLMLTLSSSHSSLARYNFTSTQFSSRQLTYRMSCWSESKKSWKGRGSKKVLTCIRLSLCPNLPHKELSISLAKDRRAGL